MSSRDPKFCERCGQALVPFADEGRVRMRCERCGFVAYGNPTPVVAAIVEHRLVPEETEPRAVLLARGVGWPDKMFGLITGFLEAGESPEVGVLREVKEELGLDAEVRSLVGAYAFEMRNELIVAYHVLAIGAPQVGSELAEIKRVPVAKLRPWEFGTGLAVRDWLAQQR